MAYARSFGGLISGISALYPPQCFFQVRVLPAVSEHYERRYPVKYYLPMASQVSDGLNNTRLFMCDIISVDLLNCMLLLG